VVVVLLPLQVPVQALELLRGLLLRLLRLPGESRTFYGQIPYLDCARRVPAVGLPLSIAQNLSFIEQLVSFVVHMDADRLDAEPMTTKAGSKVPANHEAQPTHNI
jgi:hypothetical protein